MQTQFTFHNDEWRRTIPTLFEYVIGNADLLVKFRDDGRLSQLSCRWVENLDHKGLACWAPEQCESIYVQFLRDSKEFWVIDIDTIDQITILEGDE